MSGFGQSRERAERLVTLVSLLRQGHPVTLTQLREHYRLYADSAEASARRTFERDKAELRNLGVEIATVQVDGTSAYWIRSAGATVAIRWTDQELDTLAVLSAAISDDATGVALAKLSAASGQFPADEATARIQMDLAVQPEVVSAMTQRRQLSLRYRNADGVVSDRVIEPWELRARRGLLYLAAYDVGVDAERTFRLDRIVGGLAVGGDARHPRPRAALRPVYPDERYDIDVEVPNSLRHDVAVMGGHVTGERDDWLTARFEDARPEPVVSWCLRHGAVVRGPATLATEQRRRLERLVERHRGSPSRVELPRTPKARTTTLSPIRLQRLLALPGWIGERPGITRDEIAAAFGASREEIDAELDLLDLIYVPGLGSLGRIEEVGGQLEYLRYVEDPVVELTPTDALRLLLLVEAGAAVLTEDEAPGLRSIADRLRAEVPATVDLELAGVDHPDLSVLKSAIRDHEVVRFQYKGRKDADWRDRQVVPVQLRVANGAVYLAGTDVVAGEERNFRLDRLSHVELIGRFPAPAADTPRPAYVPTQPEIETVLLVTTRATWLVTQVAPLASTATDDGGAVMVVRTDAVDWLLSHVMAVGGEAEVVGPAALRARIVEASTALLGHARDEGGSSRGG